jgi:hypothetical protein
VLLVRFSPRDAPGAYWSMTSTAFSLIISSIVTSVKKEISLLDAIVVVYGTSLLPSAFPFHSHQDQSLYCPSLRRRLAFRKSWHRRPTRTPPAPCTPPS